jgi:spore germination protein KB
MIRPTDSKLGVREFASLLVLTIAIKLTDTTPSILFLQGHNAAWMIPLFSAIIIIIPVALLLSLLKRHEGKGLMELLTQTFGQSIGFAVGFILFVYTLLFSSINSRSYVDIINVMMYQRTPVPALYIMLLFVAWFVANRGLEAVGRTAWVVIPYITVILWSLVYFVWNEIDWLHLYPIAGPGYDRIAQQGVLHSAMYGELILMMVLASNVRSFRSYRFSTWLALAVSCVELVVLMSVYVAAFDYPSVVQLAYPFQHLTRAASIGKTLTHVESMFFGFWIISASIHFAISIYVTAFVFGKMLRLKEFEPMILPLTALILLLGLIPSHTQTTLMLRDAITQCGSLLFISLPFLLWITDRIRRRKVS